MAAAAAAGCMLAGPASRNNGGCCDCSSTGLLAYGAGSSVVVVDTRSMQLVCVIPMPPPSSSPLALAPFVTSVRWIPNLLHRDLLSDDPPNAPHHLRLAVGDRQGRIGIFDARSRLPLLWMETFESPSSSSSSSAATSASASSPSSSSKSGIQDLCFVRPDCDTKVLASLNGSSILSLWNPSTGRCFWKYDASPEFFSCMCVDPFDSRHLCALGLKGFLLSIKVLGEREDDVIIKERQISVSDSSDIQRIEKDAAASNTQISSITPAFAVFPLVFVKFCFSPHWKHILYAVFPRELLIFDMQYGTALFSTGLPRGCSKFLDVMADVDHNDRLYCAHIDGKISVWRRNEGEQVHLMCFMEELMPSLGTTAPSPNILAVTLYPAESVLENVGDLCSDLLLKSPLHAVEDGARSLDRELLLASDTFLISISDDGKIWKWLLTAEGVNRNSSNMKAAFDNSRNIDSILNTEQVDSSSFGHIGDSVKESGTGSCHHIAPSAVTAAKHELVFKVCLVGQLHLLSSTLTVLAAPCPSLTATLARGGNSPAAVVPLVALGTQGGVIDVVDVAANAVATSLSVHGTAIKGLRWLGNSRLVSFSYSQDTQDPLANALLQPQFLGTLVLELDWLLLRTDSEESLALCIAGADSSFRLIEVCVHDGKFNLGYKLKPTKERPMPLCSPVLLPTAHALALKMMLQLGVKPSWFEAGTTICKSLSKIPEIALTSESDLRRFMIESANPQIGDSAVPEMLLKVLEPYRKEGCLLDNERVRLYAKLVDKGYAVRFAFAALLFGDPSEALFWLQLPHFLYLLTKKSLDKSPQMAASSSSSSVLDHRETATTNLAAHSENALSQNLMKLKTGSARFSLMAFEQGEIHARANERIPWHEKLDGEDAIQKRVHELVSVGNLEAAVTLLLSTPPEGSYFYVNALRAVALSSAVSMSLHELAVKVVAANMVRTEKSLYGTHLLCAVGRYQEACSQLQDAGYWTDAATLAATHLHGSDYARVLQRWADHTLHNEHNIWRALMLYVASGGIYEALSALRASQLPDAPAMFLLACHEIISKLNSPSENSGVHSSENGGNERKPKLLFPLIGQGHEDVTAVGEYYGHYQRKIIHLCMDTAYYLD